MNNIKFLALNVFFCLMYTFSLFSVSVIFKSQEEFDSQMADLPEQVDNISLYKKSWDEVDFSFLSQFSELKELEFRESKLPPIYAWKSLFEKTNIFPVLPSLEKISIHATILSSFSGGLFEWLAKFENLKEIDLSECRGIFRSKDDEPLPFNLDILSSLPNLETLNLSATADSMRQSPEALYGLAELQNLKSLIYSRNHFYPEQSEADEASEIKFILSLNLEELDLSYAGGNSSMKDFNILINLKELFSEIRPDLKKLVLNNTNIAGLDFSEFIPNLELLEISQTKFDSFDLRQLGGFNNLKQLSMQNSQFTRENLSELGSAPPLMYLEEINFSKSSVKGLKYSFAPLLKKLDLSQTNVSNGDVKTIAQLSDLESLDVSHTHVNGTAIKHILKLKKLTTLNLSGLDLYTAGFEQLNFVQNLDLQDSILSLDAFLSLKELQNLTTLNLKNIQSKHISKDDIAELANLLPNCEVVY